MEGLVDVMANNENQNGKDGGLIAHFWSELEKGGTPQLFKTDDDNGQFARITKRIDQGEYKCIEGELFQLAWNGHAKHLCNVPAKCDAVSKELESLLEKWTNPDEKKNTTFRYFHKAN